jgi:hypothetical protein
MENPEKLVFSNVYLRTQDEDEQNKNTPQCASYHIKLFLWRLRKQVYLSVDTT